MSHEHILSEECASRALDMEWGHEKCSYRRAIARLKISQSTGGNVGLLRKAKSDVLNAARGPSTTKLLQQIEAEIEKLKKSERNKFSRGFENALAGKF